MRIGRRLAAKQVGSKERNLRYAESVGLLPKYQRDQHAEYVLKAFELIEKRKKRTMQNIRGEEARHRREARFADLLPKNSLRSLLLRDDADAPKGMWGEGAWDETTH